MNVYLESLGCAKNMVDSEIILGQFADAGWQIVEDPARAETIIVNTCSFIKAAADESIDTILELARFKAAGSCRRLLVIGCLPERYREAISTALPEVDAFLGTGAFDRVVAAAEAVRPPSGCCLPDPDLLPAQAGDARRMVGRSPTAYLKIAEGCDRRCTYCIIPKLRGRQRSRPVREIEAEARGLIDQGIKELTLVAQETTAYGHDRDRPGDLARLLARLAGISGDVWIRLMYGHPASIDAATIAVMGEHANICAYFDLPVQHAASGVLKRMGRTYTRDDLYRLFERIRTRVPEAALRTTVIVGFPGESDQDFKDLEQMVEKVRFDHLGVFTYSDAEDLLSHGLDRHVDPQVAERRYDSLMRRQMQISSEVNQAHVKKAYPVLVEAAVEPGLYAGRTFFQAPEVDGITFVRADRLNTGQFVRVGITDALEYDLSGEPV